MPSARLNIPSFALLAFTWLLFCKPAASQARRDSQAVQFLQQSAAALSVNNVVDATLNATVQYTSGSDEETGTGVLKAKGNLESSAVLSLQNGARTEIRQDYQGSWSVAGAQARPMAYHNCLNTAAWFLPHFLVSSAISNQALELVYVGLEDQGGTQVQHLSIAGVISNPEPFVTALSQTEVYLDATTFKPVSIVFNLHPDGNALQTLPVAILFGDYQPVNGIQAPFHIQKLLQSTLMLDITVTQVSTNSGLSDSDFAIQ